MGPAGGAEVNLPPRPARVGAVIRRARAPFNMILASKHANIKLQACVCLANKMVLSSRTAAAFRRKAFGSIGGLQ